MLSHAGTNHPWKNMDDMALLRSAKVFLKDYQTGKEGFSLAGVKYYTFPENSSVRIIMDTKIINYPISLYETF